MFRIPICALAGALAAMPAAASTYDLLLNFTTSKPQLVVVPGDSPSVSGNATFGHDWDSRTPMQGGIVETSVPNPALATWTLCQANPFPDCGPRPPATITVRNGAAWWTESTGTLDFTLEAGASAASVSPALDWGVAAVVPDAGSVAVGEAFSLRPTSAASAGTMNLSSFEAGVTLDIALKVTDVFHAEECIANRCQTWSQIIDSVDGAGELVSITPQEIRFFDGFMPPYSELTIPVGNVRADLLLGILPPYLQVGFSNGLPAVPEGVLGLALDIASTEVNVPEVEARGILDASGLLRAVGQDDFLDTRDDIDALFGFAGGLLVDVGPFQVSVDHHDLEAGTSFDLFTEVDLTSALGVRLAFDRPVQIIGGDEVSMWQGAWNAMPDFAVTGPTLFSPTFYLDAEMTARQGVQYGWAASLEILKGAVQLGPLTQQFGPAEEYHFEYNPDLFRMFLFETSFDYEGFNEIAGDSFWVIPSDPATMAPVPLPATGVLLLTLVTGLGMAVVRRG